MENKQPIVRGLRSDNTTGFKGVTPYKDNGYLSRITWQGRRIRLGIFEKAEDAAKAYNRAAIELHGVKAILNIEVIDETIKKYLDEIREFEKRMNIRLTSQ